MRREQTRVLVVEADRRLNETMTSFLARRHVCASAGTLADVSRQVARWNFDVVIASLLLPDGNGLDAFAQARSRGGSPACILIIGDPVIEEPMGALCGRGATLMQKPFTFRDLVERVDQLLCRRLGLQQLAEPADVAAATPRSRHPSGRRAQSRS